MNQKITHSIIICLWSLIFLFLFIQSPPPVEALNPNHECNTCHSLHHAPGQKLNNWTVVEDLCLSCHGPAGTATRKAEVHTNKQNSAYPAFTMTCLDCHNPHKNRPNHQGGTNLMLVGERKDGTGNAKISTPNSGIRDVVFTSRGTDAGGPSIYSFADNDEDNNGIYDGICEVCHTQTANHRNESSGNHSHYTGTNCTACHGHTGNFLAEGGGCTACHGSPQDKGDGGPTRRAMTGEFSLISHHVAGGTVSDDDCGVCHYEAVDGAYHQNNMVDLRNPDNASASAVISFPQFSRNTSSDSLESWVLDVQNNFCLKCHDSNGATATHFSGNPLRPFASNDRDVPNVFAQFDTGNGSHHAVRGPGANPYCVPSSSNGNKVTMAPPWNQDSTHDQISCFDCHGASGHGSDNQMMLRTPIDLDGMATGTLSTTIGTQVETFCIRCHSHDVYVGPKAAGFADSKAAGSVMEYHGDAQSQHGAAGGNELGCMGCHAGIVNYDGGLPSAGNGSARGNIHGVTFTWSSGTFSSGVQTEHFMLGGWISGWYTFTDRGTPYGGCGGGDCNHTGRSNSEGKKYVR